MKKIKLMIKHTRFLLLYSQKLNHTKDEGEGQQRK